MRANSILTWAILVLASLVTAVPAHRDSQKEASKEIMKLQDKGNSYVTKTIKHRESGCTADKILYRQEWGSLRKKARLEYIKAVQCLRKKAPLSSIQDVPGARSRYDDFSAVHIQQTPKVHFSGLFLPFHRHFVWLYEKALRDECGYTGTQPYWDWTISWKDPRKSTVFDGSPYSLGSNGESIPHGPTNISAFGLSLTMQPGTGGGCVYSGPFANTNVTLGPVAFEPRGPNGGLGYNPRCLSRDLSLEWGNNTKPTDVLSQLTTCNDVGCFEEQLEAINGVHAGGHFTMGGLGIDAYSSAGDPAFWLHHANVDRMWTLWQNLAPKKRINQVSGTGTAFNNPPSPKVSLDTPIEFGVLGQHPKVKDIVSTIDGNFCYMYI